MYRECTAVSEASGRQTGTGASTRWEVRRHDSKEARNEGSHHHQPDPAGVASAGLDRPRCLRTRDPGDRGRGAAVHERPGGPRLEPLRRERARQPSHCARHARRRPGAAGFRASRGDGAGRRLRRRQRDRRRASAVSRRASAGLAVGLEGRRRRHRRVRGAGRAPAGRGADAAAGGARVARQGLRRVARGDSRRRSQAGRHCGGVRRRCGDARRARRRRTL